VLTAIQPDKKDIETRTFKRASDVTTWLKPKLGVWNIYYSVNPTTGPVNKKAQREDIAAVEYLHIDLDPREGEDLEAERERIKKILLDPPHGIPPPTMLVFSGGGYNALWKLEDPIPVNGDMALAEDAKRWNQQLEILLGADNVHNIDRILRLPGTINVPDVKKKKRGRTPTEAVLELHEADRVYLLAGNFTQAVEVQDVDPGAWAGSGESTNATPVTVSGNVERLGDVMELDEWGVPDRVKVIIVQGSHPEEPPKSGDSSRSGYLFDVICNMVRCDVPDDVVYSVITDPDFLISASVLDKAPNVGRYAARQIGRAKEEAVDPWLRRLNETYAVVMNIGGKCRVIEELPDPNLDRSRLTRITFPDFANSYMHQKIQTGVSDKGVPQFMPVGKWWLENASRRQYKSVVFAPNRDVPQCYNLWTGFAVSAVPGNCQPFKDHMLDNVCHGNQAYYDYLWGWMANAVQYPGYPGQVAVVMRGALGTGKSFFAKEFGALFGRHFLQVSDPKHLVGSFNAHLRDCVVLFGDEAFFAGDKKHESTLKMLVTEEILAIESKGVDVETSANCTHIILASNKDWVVPAGARERRYFVLDVGDEQKQNATYFKDLFDNMTGGGRSALLHELLHTDLSEFQVRNVPKTGALKEQQELSLTIEEEWWFNKLSTGLLLDGDGSETPWPPAPLLEALRDDFVAHNKRFNTRYHGNDTTLGIFLVKVLPGLTRVRKRVSVDYMDEAGRTFTKKERKYVYTMPTLTECRGAWVAKYGDHQWPEQQQEALPVTKDEIPF
jgi:hypothetical protein|tara:strand:+ start:9828 stop:12170 length:2343 start_codon:yes stop_codon:yes gene_type:complete